MRLLLASLLLAGTFLSCNPEDYTEPTALEEVQSDVAMQMIASYPELCKAGTLEPFYSAFNPAGLDAFARDKRYDVVRMVAAAYPSNWPVKELQGKPTMLIQMGNSESKAFAFFHAPKCCPPPGNCRGKLTEIVVE